MDLRGELVQRAREYAARRGLLIREQLGYGVHGTVLVVESQGDSWALKVHESEAGYARERDVYLRLKALGIQAIRGCHVPELLRHDDEFRAIEMSIVTRPFVLDFAGAYLDHQPDFSEEVLADWQAEKKEQFGAYWPEVQAILNFLEGLGIFMIDVSPNNVSPSVE